MRRLSSLAILLTLAAGAVGCASLHSQRKDAAPASSAKIPSSGIWVPSPAPSPLPIVRLVPGEEKRVSLLGAASRELFTLKGAKEEQPIGCAIILEPDAIVVRANPGSDGRTMIHCVVETLPGVEETLSFPVIIQPLPIHTFTFRPEAGKTVEKVVAAGSFNGWSQESDVLEKQPDGSFSLTRAVPPGIHNYKLVVDGTWMADPANPERDSSGYGNSILRIEGEAQGTFEFAVLSNWMPGAGTQGALKAVLPLGVALDPGSIILVVNNRRRSISDWEIDHQTATLQLKLPVSDWLSENTVTVLAKTTDGKSGTGVFPMAYSSAPRSPRDEVIYFPMTDRFHDGDPANNPPTPTEDVLPLARYHGGDWKGIEERIRDGYLPKLGVTTIWVSPPYQNTTKIETESVPPGRLFSSYHGYWPTSSTETNPAYGSMDDLRSLIKTAHENDIAVLLDYVSNHVHEDHPLYQADPDIATPYILPNGKKNLREFDAHPYTTWFDDFLPSFDYERRPDLIDRMTDNAVYWLRETGADGFRHDAVKHVPEPFWRELTRKLRREIIAGDNRRIYQVGETISGHATVAKFVGSDMLDGQFDFPTYFAIQGALGRGTGKMSDLAEAIRGAHSFYPPSSIMSPLIGNHDVPRFMALADGDMVEGKDEREAGYASPPVVDSPDSYDKLHLAFAFITAIEGPPTIYYGDEIGMTGAGDPDNRRPMKWDQWSRIEQETYNRVATLNKLRLESVALRRGHSQVIFADDERLVVARIAPEETVLVVLQRKAAASADVQLPMWWGNINTAELKPLGGGLNASVRDSVLTLPAGNYQFGFWRVGR